MHKKWSLYLGSVSGIKLYIHWSFLIIIVWIFLMYFRLGHGFKAGMEGVAFIVVLFACVVLHELGHALTAKRFKVLTRDITLYPIGGIASLESMPAEPLQELKVTLAGPAVNVVIGVVLWIYLKATNQIPDADAIRSGNLFNLPFAFNIMYANIVLAVFNLIPAFPMDGGRVLRSLLALKIDPMKATEVAARIGQFLAILFVFFGFFYDFWLVFIGMFLFLGASSETKIGEIKHALEGTRVKDVLITNYTVLASDTTIKEASGYLVNTNEKSFLIMKDNNVEGILDYRDIIEGLHRGDGEKTAESCMQRDFKWVGYEDQLSDIFITLRQGKQSLFPVNRDGKLAGIINAENLEKWILLKNNQVNR
jgi:Zn-dependent protease/predicted transcriptional regulator